MINNYWISKIKTKITFNKKLSLIIPFVLLVIVMLVLPSIFLFISIFSSTEYSSVADNWSILNTTIVGKIFKSVGIALASTLFCILIAYPFCYVLAKHKSKIVKMFAFSLVTLPMWLGSLVILVSLKSFIDKINGVMNSSYGDIFTIIGITYIYLPYMMIPLYNCLEQMPNQLVYASKDLGRNNISTFFRVVIPYTKQALLSGVTLVFLPSITVVAIPQFLNNSNDGNLIGDVIMQQGQQAFQSKLDLSRASVLSVTLSLVMFVIYLLVVNVPKIYTRIKKTKTLKGVKLYEKKNN